MLEAISGFSTFENCAKHCWCAYGENDKIIKHTKSEWIVKAMKATLHEHGISRDNCTGCLTEDEKIVWTSEL